MHDLRDANFRMVAWEQCLASSDSESSTQFRGHLAMMFSCMGKCVKAIHTASMSVGREEVGEDTTDDQQHLLYCNFQRYQNKIDAQTTETATMVSESNHAFDENQKLKEMFNLDQLIETMMKVVNNMTMKESPNHLQALNTMATPITLAG